MHENEKTRKKFQDPMANNKPGAAKFESSQRRKPKLNIFQHIYQLFQKIWSFIRSKMFRYRQFTYTLERRATKILTRNLSICARNVNLVRVQPREDRLMPFEFLMTYMCNKSVDEVYELKRNPPKLTYLKDEDASKVLEDVAFMMAKENQLSAAEQKVNKKRWAKNYSKKKCT